MGMERRASLWARILPLLAVCLLGGGCMGSRCCRQCCCPPMPCQTCCTDPVVVYAPVEPLGPQAVVNWTVESIHNRRKYVMTGRSVVSPEGYMRLGPHGVVQVAGLSIDQVRETVKEHLAMAVHNPKVTMEVVVNPSPASPTVVAQNTRNRIWAAPAVPANHPVAQARREAAGHQVVSASSAAQVAEWQPAGSTDRPVVQAVPLQKPAGLDEPEPPLASEVRAAPIQTVSYRPPEAVRVEAPVVVQPVGLNMPSRLPENNGKDEDGADMTQTAPVPVATTTHPIAYHPEGVGIPGQDCGAPHELTRMPMPPYVIDTPDILLVESTQGLRDQPISGQHLVRPDGTIGLGIYGSAYVAGMTIEEAKASIAAVLSKRIKEFDIRNLSVDVLAYNSKFYYVITDGGGYGEQVYRIPFTGNETVLDGLSQINGIPPVGSKKHIWVARRGNCGSGDCKVLPVDWKAITQMGCTTTNYQIYPGDRIYVKADGLIKVDTFLAKCISPIERLFGVTLLGASTYNTIQAGNAGGTGNLFGGFGGVR